MPPLNIAYCFEDVEMEFRTDRFSGTDDDLSKPMPIPHPSHFLESSFTHACTNPADLKAEEFGLAFGI